MRLSKIKLAGFKSFVDPTTVHFPSNLVGIVGPNGCGKSNVIDAIRWVMGETSARHLRGDSMEDVIFSGSNSRKPVGSAAIELFFDNSDGTLGGQYAGYAEISIRRMVSRDGVSQYFLNNTRCRRKDITSLFMGTGLGPRSYAIIEQGMVSRLVDAKPEEMRSYIEEAAGISKYKERRRETETRIHNTRENLARLADLRTEVEKQIKHLQRQAQVAERYKALKQQERQLEAELLSIRLAELDQGLGTQRGELSSRQTGLEAAIAGQRQVEADIERARARHVEVSDRFTAVQANYYAVQSEIARLEQTIAHTRESRERQLKELAGARTELESINTEVGRDTALVTGLDLELADFGPRLEAVRLESGQAGEELRTSEVALTDWQQRWHGFNLDVKEQQQLRQLEHTRLEHIGAHRDRLTRQLDSVEGERSSISVVDLEARLQVLLQNQAETLASLESETRNLEEVERRLAAQRDVERQLGADVLQLRGELESRRGRLDTLRAIQNTAFGNEEEVLGEWLASTGLARRHRLVQELVAEDRWTRAIETVLGDFLQAICVEDSGRHLAALPDTSLVLLDSSAADADPGAASGTLAACVRNSGQLHGVLSAVRCANTLDEALQLRRDLRSGESVITPEGVWLGARWVRISRGQRHVGMMAREQEIRTLSEAVAEHEVRAELLAGNRIEARQAIEALEQQRLDAQSRLTEVSRQSLEATALVAGLQTELDRARQRLETLDQDSSTVQDELVSVGVAIDEARERLAAAEAALAALEERRPVLRQQQDDLLLAYNGLRERAEERRTAVAQIQIEYEGRRTAHGAAIAALDRLVVQQRQLEQRMAMLTENISASEAPLQESQQELDGHLAHQLEIQQQLNQQRDELSAVESEVKTAEVRRHELEKQVEASRELVEGLRVSVRELEVRRETLAERFAATGIPMADMDGQLPENADAGEWDQRLQAVRTSVERLGPINLAAISEFSEQSERKAYLDSQHADLSDALETLEHAIRRIDRETRTRFQETFDNINSGLKRLFPRLFGGGHAYLSLDGDDLLSAGVTVMARPPGKRNSHIHLLSGGEKALTAVALIFSIFELNPAPFCLLDEVDAPLDEANVNRFCDIVREMSRTVQFIVITHNKTTMEMARQLTGVTMNEPGVSRLVAVDIDEAVKLVAS
ncbi:MAG: chromosome segregation protein SMC [Gammaproteobacteria bacterium]